MLLLGNNNIVNLEGISQFKNLESLSVANNALTTMQDICELFQCKNLKTLYLQGNVVSSLPHYRHHVISGLTELKVLDGKKITHIEQNHAHELLHQEEIWMNGIFANDCTLLTLQQTFRKSKMHLEFLQQVHGNFQCFRREIDLNTAQLPTEKMTTLVRHYIWKDEEYKKEIIESIRTKAHDICATLHNMHDGEKCVVEVWNRAFSKIFKTQQQCITSAFNQLEKLKFQMTNQRNEIKSKIVLQEPKAHLPEKISSTFLSKKLKALQEKIKLKKRKQKRQRKKPRDFNEENDFAREREFQQEELNNLHIINDSLRKKLNDFHKQNVHNVYKAKKKIHKYENEVSNLEIKNCAMEEKIEKIESHCFNLEKAFFNCQRSDSCNSDIKIKENVSTQIVLLLQELKESRSDTQFYKDQCKQGYFGVVLEKHQIPLLNVTKEIYRDYYKKNSIQKWNFATKLNKFKKRFGNILKKERMILHFKLWKKMYDLNQISKNFVESSSHQKLNLHFKNWKIKSKENEKIRRAILILHMKKQFNNWNKMVMERRKIYRGPKISRKASIFYDLRSRQTKTLKNWKQYAQSKRKMRIDSKIFYEQRNQEYALTQWIDFHRREKDKKINKELAEEFAKLNTYRSYFHTWMYLTKRKNEFQKKEERIEKIKIYNLFKIWKRKYEEQLNLREQQIIQKKSEREKKELVFYKLKNACQNRRNNMIQATSFQDSIMYKYFFLWNNFKLKNQSSRKMWSIACSYHDNLLKQKLKTIFKSWGNIIETKLQSIDNEKIESNILMVHMFHHWNKQVANVKYERLRSSSSSLRSQLKEEYIKVEELKNKVRSLSTELINTKSFLDSSSDILSENNQEIQIKETQLNRLQKILSHNEKELSIERSRNFSLHRSVIGLKDICETKHKEMSFIKSKIDSEREKEIYHVKQLKSQILKQNSIFKALEDILSQSYGLLKDAEFENVSSVTTYSTNTMQRLKSMIQLFFEEECKD